MRDWKINRIYSEAKDKITAVMFAKKIEEEERQRKLTVAIVVISAAVAVVAAVAAGAIYLASKTEDGERRGKLIVEKIKSKLPCKKAEECCCECDCEEEAEEACECECAEEACEE